MHTTATRHTTFTVALRHFQSQRKRLRPHLAHVARRRSCHKTDVTRLGSSLSHISPVSFSGQSEMAKQLRTFMLILLCHISFVFLVDI